MECSCFDNTYLIISLSISESRRLLCLTGDCKYTYLDDKADAATQTLLAHIIAKAMKITGMTRLTQAPIEPLVMRMNIRIEAKLVCIFVCRESDYAKISEQKIEELIYNSTATSKMKIKLKPRCNIYSFDDFFAAYDCISALISHNITMQKCELFLMNNHYFLRLSFDAENRRKSYNILAEFGRRCTSKTERFFAERATLICEDFCNVVTGKNQK